MPFEYNANVVRVVDGDTLIVDIDLGFHFWFREQTIRLHGVDCPETKSKDKEEVAHGKLAKKFTEDFCANSNNKILIQTDLEEIVKNKEKFGRILAVVWKPNKGENLNISLIKNFLGVEYYGISKEEIKAAHLKNRQKLFKNDNVV
jgi:micrococcal nuclease